MGHLYYDNKNFAGGAFEKKIIKSVYFGAELLWPHLPPVLTVDPLTIKFEGLGSSFNVNVTIANKPDALYSIITPSWLSVTNKTQTGFTLTAGENLTGALLDGEVIVSLDDFPNQTQTIEVQQAIEPLIIIYYDASISSTAIINLSNDVDWQSTRIDWGDGTIVDAIQYQNVHTYTDTSKVYKCTIRNLLNVPANLTYVGTDSNKNIVEVQLMGGLTSIGLRAFWWAVNLKKINISNTLVETIGDSAFGDCHKLSGLIKLENVTYVSPSAFIGVGVDYKDPNSPSGDDLLPGSPMLDVDLTGSPMDTFMGFSYVSNLRSMKISEKTPNITNNALTGCFSLTDLLVPYQGITIGSQAFSGCRRLTGTIKINAVSIGTGAMGDTGNKNNPSGLIWDLSDSTITEVNMFGSSGANQIILPPTITQVSDWSLSYTSQIQILKFNSTTPPITTGNPGLYPAPAGFIILVPINSVAAYKQATYWTQFQNNIQGF